MIVFDLVLMRNYSHLKIRQNLHFASCSFGRCHFHQFHSYREEGNRRHWLAEAAELTAFDRFLSGHRIDDHLESSASLMKASRCHHSLFETDPDSVDSADAVAALESQLDVTVAGAEQGFAVQLVDWPIWLGLCFDTGVEMCQIRKGTRY